MTDLSLTRPGLRSGYASQRRRSPSALAAAIAFNGGVFALIIALPATQYVIDKGPRTETHWVPLDPIPDEVKQDPVKKDPVPTQKTIEQPISDPKPFVMPPVLPFTGGDVIDGTRDPGPIGPITDPPKPVVVPHTPVFQGATRDPRYEGSFHPPYPPALVREGLEGSVTVRVTIDEKGRVIACDLVKATNKAFFDETREQALKRWRFRPATSDGVAVQSQQTLTVTFQLEA